MFMDFDIVKRQICKAYCLDESKWDWSLNDFVYMFNAYYTYFADIKRKNHPRLKTGTIYNVMTRLQEYDLNENLEMMELYFHTAMDCDYSIVHFTSGHIREIRILDLEKIQKRSEVNEKSIR